MSGASVLDSCGTRTAPQQSVGGQQRRRSVSQGRQQHRTLHHGSFIVILVCASLELSSSFRLPPRAGLLARPQSLPSLREHGWSSLGITGRGRAVRPFMCAGQTEQVGVDVGFDDYINKLPERLVAHLENSPGDQESREQTRRYIIELEQLQNYPLDPSFHNYAVTGEWRLLYSTSRISAPDTNLKLRTIRSKWDARRGKIVHHVAWEFTEDEDYHTRGTFEVVSNFSYGETPSMPARTHLDVDALELSPEPLNRPPRDPQALVSALQRALPKEFFDPDGAVLDTTYLNPTLRIACFLGMRFAGVRHVYGRVLPSDDAA